MKKVSLLAVISMLTTVNAFACADFSGVYNQCEVETTYSDMYDEGPAVDLDGLRITIKSDLEEGKHVIVDNFDELEEVVIPGTSGTGQEDGEEFKFFSYCEEATRTLGKVMHFEGNEDGSFQTLNSTYTYQKTHSGIKVTQKGVWADSQEPLVRTVDLLVYNCKRSN